MAGVMRNQFTEGMKKDLYAYFFEMYPQKPSVWETLFEVVPSDAAYDQFTSAIGLGELLEKPEGEDLQSDAPMESYTIVCKNRSFGRTVNFSYESVQDAKKPANLFQSVVGSWAKMVPITKEKHYAKFFNYGAYTAGNDVFNNSITNVVTDSSGDLIYDSKAFFATDHPDRVGNTYANYTQTRALSQANLQTTYLTYTTTNNRDERGEVIELSPDTLLIPPALKFTAAVILNTTLIPGSQDNDVNTMNGILEPVEWSYLTDSDGWFIGSKKMGILSTTREGISIDFWMDELSKDYHASIFTRFGGCVTNWRHWYACNISTS